jgi:superfamily II DNA or RNA helicase
MVLGPDTRTLIDEGFLSDFEVYAPPAQDWHAVKKTGGDYNMSELDKAVRKAKITGDAVAHYKKLAPGKSAIVFCTSVATAEDVAESFRAAGYNFQSIDGTMDADKRRALIDDMTAGRITGLTSCDIISEGTDIPRIECVILLRPTASTGLHRQQLGRGLRLFPGKERLIVLDHVGNTMAHGLPDENITWSLDGGAGGGKGRTAAGPKLRNCPSCLAVHKTAPVCPRCGHAYEVKARTIEYEEGELQRVERGVAGTGKPLEYWEAALKKLQQIERQRGYKPGWAQYILRSRQAKARAGTDALAAAVEQGLHAGRAAHEH